MTPMHQYEVFIEEIRKFFDSSVSLIEKKNSDYAGTEDPFKNFRMAELLGLTVEEGIMLRMLDKMSRLANTHKTEGVQVSSETVDDTIRDLAGYAAILHAYREMQKIVATPNNAPPY